eukprot:TRINITY_DN49425_c0_g1_i1.p1 TRINITY_DN49425_c0_g1~~TRINITY_DN49425_c0_g1_i1.p1  ORF type:complete len:477 (+),score=67.56 TRINITY_DN49425_c0_g1_i1:64-1494(+)
MALATAVSWIFAWTLLASQAESAQYLWTGDVNAVYEKAAGPYADNEYCKYVGQAHDREEALDKARASPHWPFVAVVWFRPDFPIWHWTHNVFGILEMPYRAVNHQLGVDTLEIIEDELVASGFDDDKLEIGIGPSLFKDRCVTTFVPVECDSDAGDREKRVPMMSRGLLEQGPLRSDDYTFDIVVTRAEICAYRTDKLEGWEIDLVIWCKIANTTEPDCLPMGMAVNYPETYETPPDIGRLYGWDSSDKRFRYPPNNNVDGYPGGVATPFYTHPETGAIAYLGSSWIAKKDAKYLKCLNISAFVDVDAIMYDAKPMVDEIPWYQIPYPEYVFSPARPMPRALVPSFSSIRVYEDSWMIFWNQLRQYMDQRMQAGQNIFVFDGTQGCGPGDREMELCEEWPRSCGPDCTGCGAAACVAIAYKMVSENITLNESYDTIHRQRRCIEAIYNRSMIYLPYHHYVWSLEQIEKDPHYQWSR